MEERFETFTVLINRISRNIKKLKNQEMEDYNLRSVHISCLYYLYTSGEAIAADLCEKCGEDKATISRAIEYLESNGFIECEGKFVKRYRSPLVLTDKGIEVGKKIADKINFMLDEVSSGLTNDDRIALYRCLNLISNNLDRVCYAR